MRQDKKTGEWTTDATRYHTEAEAEEVLRVDRHPEGLSIMRLSDWLQFKMGRRKPPKTEVTDA